MTIAPFTHDSPDWHAMRARHVGGSEIAALFDCQPAYALSRFALWHVKAGSAGHPPVPGERPEWGIRLEQAIAQAAAERWGWPIRKGGYVVDDTTPGLGCSLDFIIDADPDEKGPGCLEIKNVDWLIHRSQWSGDEPPIHILLQLQHQMAATGFTWGAVAGLVGGNRLELYRYKARPALIQEIRRRVAAFWQSIADRKEPDADGSDGADHVLRQLYPVLEPEPVDLSGDNEMPDLCARLVEISAQRLAAEKDEDGIKARIMQKLGAHRSAIVNGFTVRVAVTPENPGRPAEPGELIGVRGEVRRLNVKEMAA